MTAAHTGPEPAPPQRGSVRATVMWALIRALLGAVLVTAATFFTTLASVEDDCQASSPAVTTQCEPGRRTAEEKALLTALAAGFTYLGSRGLVEGAVDAGRQNLGLTFKGDVHGK